MTSKDFIGMKCVLYIKVSKEEYNSFISNYFATHYRHKGTIKTHQNGWSEMYDFKVSKDTPIVRSSSNGEYYILNEVYKND